MRQSSMSCSMMGELMTFSYKIPHPIEIPLGIIGCPFDPMIWTLPMLKLP
jgi:hypothetical protein